MITSQELLARLRQRTGAAVIVNVNDGQWLVEVADFYSRETLVNQDEVLTLIGTATQPNKPETGAEDREPIPFFGIFKAKEMVFVE